MIHVEIFVTSRDRRDEFRRRSRLLYRQVRSLTRRAGGDGPSLYLVTERRRTSAVPVDLRRAVGARRHDDVWIELAHYPSELAMKSILRDVWRSPRVRLLAGAVERLIRYRSRGWLLATARSQRV